MKKRCIGMSVGIFPMCFKSDEKKKIAWWIKKKELSVEKNPLKCKSINKGFSIYSAPSPTEATADASEGSLFT